MPQIIPGKVAIGFMTDAQRALGLTQEQLGDMLGASRRTISRMVSGRSPLSSVHLHELARAIHPKDPILAAKLAVEGGETLEGLGIVRPASPAVPLPPPVAGRPFPATRLVVDSVVCAAAETMQAPPAAVREALRAAVARARALGLSLEEMDEGLAPPVAAARGAKAGAGTARSKSASGG